MTDEEMAEQFADNISGLELTCSLLSAKDKSHSYRLGRYDGFLAGLKAGRPQWHYVKDGEYPKDKTEKEYLVALKSEYRDFFYETDIWCESLHCFASNNPKKVYAWKEIVPPKEIE